MSHNYPNNEEPGLRNLQGRMKQLRITPTIQVDTKEASSPVQKETGETSTPRSFPLFSSTMSITQDPIPISLPKGISQRRLSTQPLPLYKPSVNQCQRRSSFHQSQLTSVMYEPRVRNYVQKLQENPDLVERQWKTWKEVTTYDSLYEMARAFMELSKIYAKKAAQDETEEVNVKKFEYRALQILQHITQPNSKFGSPGQLLPEAQVMLGKCYARGHLGLVTDEVKAYRLFSSAAKQVHPDGTFQLAMCFQKGLGTRPDPSRFLQYLERAAKLRHPSACKMYGKMLLTGEHGVPKNPPNGKLYLEWAVKYTNEMVPEFMYELALINERPGVELGLIVDPELALHLYSKAAAMGHVLAQFAYARCFQKGRLGAVISPQDAFYWYAQAAEQCHPPAQLKLGEFYFKGLPGIVEADHTNAFAWVSKAADHGLSQAEYALGFFYEKGIGVDKDFDQARRWYMRSAHQNFEPAVERLKHAKVLFEDEHQSIFF